MAGTQSQEQAQAMRKEGQWDPLLPSSPEDEQLQPILTQRSGNAIGAHGGPQHNSETQHDTPIDASAYGFSNEFLEDMQLGDFNQGIFRTGTGMTQDEPMSATSLTGRSINTVSRKSTGLANLSSQQLMSPMLTVYDYNSPGSTMPEDSPIVHHKVLGGGSTEDISAAETVEPWPAFETPSASKSSANTSMNSNRQAATTMQHKKRRGSEPSAQGDDEDVFSNAQTITTAKPRHGLDPASRGRMQDAEVPTLTEQATKRAVAAKNKDIANWLSTSELTSADHDHLTAPNPGVKTRRRSRSTGDKIVIPPHVFQQNLDVSQEVSDDEEEDDIDSDLASYHEEAPANFARRPVPRPSIGIHTPDPSDEPKPQDAYPWVDPVKFPSEEGAFGQPETANEAMMKFLSRARDIETASRAATWGTQRRMSDGDPTAITHHDRELQRIFGHGGLLSRLHLSAEKEAEYKEEWKNFKEHAIEKANRWLPKRDSFHRNHPPEPIRSPSSHSHTSPAPSIKSKRESTHDFVEGVKARIHRHSSAKKPGDLFTGSFSGDPGSSSPPEAHSPTSTIHAFASAVRGSLSRHGSKDDGSSHLASLWKTQSGGPPVAPIAYPRLTQSPANKSTAQFKPPTSNNIFDAVPMAEPAPINTNPTLLTDKQLPIPTLEGFRIDARRRLPNMSTLAPFLVDRLALEQFRRYKKLLEAKAKHARLVAAGNGVCPHGAFCTANVDPLVKYYPAKAQKEPVISQIGVNMAGDGDDDEEALAEGQLSENSLPAGMPKMPANKLPAEFECHLCFQIKRFNKPSDWSKHVHEDLQPFTCTFNDCTEPKSFKRKADWVRHENERHRHLEWWQCDKDGCMHQCYRRDNFQHHLVREHKLPEPKAKTIKPDNKPAVRGPAKTKGKGNLGERTPENEVLFMLEHCRHETTKPAITEPCRLCGKAFHTYKKLTVELAKHMEELSLPVLDLVAMKEVDEQTIVSPIENKPTPTFSQMGQSPYMASNSVSPFDNPAGISNGMPALENAFPPLGTLGMTPIGGPHFSNVSWNGVTAQPETTMYSGTMGIWPSQQVDYTNQSNHMMNKTSFATQHSGSFGQAATNMTHGMPMDYQTDTAMMADINVSPGFATDHSFNNMNQAAHNSPPLGFNGQTNPQYNHSIHGDPTLYNGQQADAMHIQQAQQHVPPQHQQQYFTSTY